MGKQSTSILVFLKYSDQEIDVQSVIEDGKVLWSGQNGFEWIGKDGERWDSVFLIKYIDTPKFQQAIERFRNEDFEQIKLLVVNPASRSKLRLVRFLMKSIFSRFSVEISDVDINLDNIPLSEILPTSEQHIQLEKKDRGLPIVMVNLLNYHNEPLYPPEYEGMRYKDGQEAYNRYGQTAMRIVAKLGGVIEYMGKVESIQIGNHEEVWDDFAFMRYPSLDAVQSMFRIRENAGAAIHRDAGLRATKVLAFSPSN